MGKVAFVEFESKECILTQKIRNLKKRRFGLRAFYEINGYAEIVENIDNHRSNLGLPKIIDEFHFLKSF